MSVADPRYIILVIAECAKFQLFHDKCTILSLKHRHIIIRNLHKMVKHQYMLTLFLKFYERLKILHSQLDFFTISKRLHTAFILAPYAGAFHQLRLDVSMPCCFTASLFFQAGDAFKQLLVHVGILGLFGLFLFDQLRRRL